MTIADRCQEVADALVDLADLNVYPFLKSAPAIPAAMVYPAAGATDTLGDGQVRQLNVVVLVQWGDDAAMENLYALLDIDEPSSIVAALSGNLSSAFGAITWEFDHTVEYAAVPYIGATIHVEVLD